MESKAFLGSVYGYKASVPGLDKMILGLADSADYGLLIKNLCENG